MAAPRDSEAPSSKELMELMDLPSPHLRDGYTVSTLGNRFKWKSFLVQGSGIRQIAVRIGPNVVWSCNCEPSQSLVYHTPFGPEGLAVVSVAFFRISIGVWADAIERVAVGGSLIKDEEALAYITAAPLRYYNPLHKRDNLLCVRGGALAEYHENVKDEKTIRARYDKRRSADAVAFDWIVSVDGKSERP